MNLERTAVEIADRKIVRRGLLAGAVALTVGALSKFTAKPALAVDPQDIDMNTVNTATATTTLNTSTGAAFEPLFKIDNLRTGSDALQANGGEGPTLGQGGRGIVATGGDNSGVSSSGPSSGGVGVRAIGGTATGFGAGGHGVEAIGGNGQGTSGGRGVSATGGGGSLGGTGVRGEGGGAAGSQGIGVEGRTNSSQSAGVQGNNFDTGPGVRGQANNGIGVVGSSVNQAGVFGQSSGAPGVHGESISSLGARGVSTDFVGVVGISTNNHGLYGFSGSQNGAALVGDNGGGLAGVFNGSVQIFGSLQVFGAPKNAVVKMPDGTNASLYCQESPEPYFEDFGRAQLVGGVARVPLEREFAVLVAGGDYMVFLTPRGDTRGLFVTQQTPAGFEVRECQGGTGSIPFTYRIVTRRKDVEGRRFARVSEDAKRNLDITRGRLRDTPSPAAQMPPNLLSPSQPPFTPPVQDAPRPGEGRPR